MLNYIKIKRKKSIIILFLILILFSSPYTETASRLNEKPKESASNPPPVTSKALPLPEVKIEPEKEGAVQPASTVKVFEGREIYKEGLKLYQEEKYEEAVAKLTEFAEIYPEGKYGENALYLIADANYIISKKDETMYRSALDAYKTAVSKFPKSHKREMSLLRMGKLYEKLKFYIEAKASYQTLVNEYPKGKYAPQALIFRAEILIGEKRFKEAHKQLERVLILYPFSTVVRDATFKIADSYFIEKDYARAEELYREASQKWPTFPKANPLVMFNMGQTYFINGKYKDARNIFFDLINLFPQNESAASSMIRIGDTYYKEGRHADAVIVYAEVISRYPESEEIYSIRMKMADAGVEQPNLVGASFIFDYTPYMEPMNTYKDIIVKNPSAPLVQEAMFKKGNLLSAENRYVEAVMTFKHLLSLYPEDKMAEDVKSAMRAAFFKIIDTYHSQKGFYGLLLTYYKNFDPFLKDIKAPKILFEIGDSYQQMGLYGKSLETFEMVVKYDSKEIYKRDISLRTGEIYYLQDRYADAENQLKKFIADYPDSPMAEYARGVIGDSLYKQGKFKEAIAEYVIYVRKKPKDFDTAKIYLNLAHSYKNIKNFSDAISSYNKAIEIMRLSKREDVRDIISEGEYQILDSLYKMGRYAEAVQTAERLVRAYPDDRKTGWALYVAADSYRQLKKEDKSMETLAKIADIAKGEVLGDVASAEMKDLEWRGKYKEELYK